MAVGPLFVLLKEGKTKRNQVLCLSDMLSFCLLIPITSNSGFNCDGTSIDGSSLFAGCTYPQALNYSGAANVDDGSCVFVGILNEVGPCLFDVSSDGIVNTPDLLIFLQYWESTCE